MENLLVATNIDEQIHQSDRADYRYRLVVGSDAVKKVFSILCESINYTNFKNQIAETPSQEDKLDAYHRYLERDVSGTAMSKIFSTPKGKIRGRNATLSELANLKSALPLGLIDLDESYKQNGYGFVTKCGDEVPGHLNSNIRTFAILTSKHI